MKYRLKLRCTACGHKYMKVVTVAEGVDLKEIKDPPCPICKKVQKRVQRDWSDGKAPGIVGMSTTTKAIDETARIVMEDNKLTDLHDTNLRPGDSMAPKLPPHLQKMADGFWGGKAAQQVVGPRTGLIAKSAMAGSFKDEENNPVAATHGKKIKPPTKVIAAFDGNQ